MANSSMEPNMEVENITSKMAIAMKGNSLMTWDQVKASINTSLQVKDMREIGYKMLKVAMELFSMHMVKSIKDSGKIISNLEMEL